MQSKMNRKCAKALSFLYQSACFLATLLNIIFTSKLYFGYHVMTKVAPFLPHDVALPKLSLCFDMTSVMNRRPAREYFTTHLAFLGKTVSQVKAKMPTPDELIEQCAYRDWNTDSMLVKQRDDCLEYFTIKLYPLQTNMCYRLTPRDTNYTFFSVTHSLEARRFLYEVTINAPLNSGHKLLPLIHFDDVPFYDRLYANEVLTSPRLRERYILSYDYYDFNSLPVPYETKCTSVSPAECFARCIDRAFKSHGRSFYKALIFNNNDSLVFPDFVKDARVIDSIYTAHKRSCIDSCPDLQECHRSIVATRIASHSLAIHKLVIEVQTLAKPGILLKTVPTMVLLQLFTHLTSVCSFWLGFSVIGFCKKLQASSPVKPSMIQLKTLEFRAEGLFRFFNLDGRLSASSPRGEVPSRIGSASSLKILSIIIKVLVTIPFSIAIYTTFSQYFEYGTITQFVYRANPMSASTHLHLCFSMERMIGFPDLPDVTIDNYDEVFMKKDSYFDEPLSVLMNKTLQINEIIKGCRLWDRSPEKLWTLTKRSKVECLDYFRTSKYFVAGDVCYSVGPERDKRLQDSKIGLVEPGIFHSIIFERIVKKFALKITLVENGDLPQISRRYGARIYPFTGKELYRVSTINREDHLLPRPYETDCNPSRPRYDCLQDCLIYQTVNGIGLLPLSEILEESVIQRLNQYEVTSYTDLKNKTTMSEWENIERGCMRKCHQPSCLTNTTITVISAPFRSQVDYELMISVRDEPDQITTTVPKTSIYWLYYQVFGCANFWLAFVILYADPFALFLKNEVSVKKLNASINRFKRQLIEASQLLHLELTSGTENCRSSVQSILPWTLRALCAVGTLTHLYMCVAEYMTYPTELYTRIQIPQETANHSILICNQFCETHIGKDFNDYYASKITREKFERTFDTVLNRSVAELVAVRPKNVGRMVGCSFRGLPPGMTSDQHMKSLTDRIYFKESNNMSICESLYSRDRHVLGGLICDQYNGKMAIDNPYQLLNKASALMGISTDRNAVDHPFEVVVSRPNAYPIKSSLWSRQNKKPPNGVWFDISSNEYLQTDLEWHYDTDGFGHMNEYSCHRDCLSSRLSQYNLTSYFAERVDWSKKFPLKFNLRDPEIASAFNTSDESCIASCLSSSLKQRMNWLMVTKVSRPLASQKVGRKSVEFLLTVTTNPIIMVVFRAKWSLCELIITLGSILSIWWGLSAPELDPSRTNCSSLASQEFNECEIYLSRIQSILLSRARLNRGKTLDELQTFLRARLHPNNLS